MSFAILDLSPLNIELYAQITELEEYYLTRTEESIFRAHAYEMVTKHLSSQNGRLNLVELGAGDGRKTEILIQALLDLDVDFEYIPIDISRQAMSNLFEALGHSFRSQHLSIHGIIGDYLDAVQHVVSVRPNRRTAVLFIGSSIGNFGHESATGFLSEVRSHLRPDDVFLLGCDLRKDSDVMRRAYSDSQGVTRDFNLNLLRRMNEELGMDFDIGAFEHLAIYDPHISAMKSYLTAAKDQKVRMGPLDAKSSAIEREQAHEFFFKAHEPLYLECSHKYTVEGVESILTKAGFTPETLYSDPRGWFVDCVSSVPPK